MNRAHRAAAVLAATGLLLTGCAATPANRSATTQTTQAQRSAGMAAGMVMPDGSTMAAAANPAAARSAVAAAGVPSTAEKMICAAETHTTIVQVLGLAATPPSTASWRNHLYTCTYRLPMGTLLVSVKQSSSPAAAKGYFQALRTRLGTTHRLDGLGQSSYGTLAGTVVLIKDNDTLTVDASRLPAVFGKQQSQRFDFAYELASDILGCWTEG